MTRHDDRMVDFMNEHGDWVRSRLRRSGVPAGDLPDLQQEAMIIAARNLQGLQEKATARAFLRTVCRRLARDRRRRASTRNECVGLVVEQAQAPSQEQRLDALRQLEVVAQELVCLPKGQRNALLSDCTEPVADPCSRGRSHKEFYARLYAARTRLRRGLALRGLGSLLLAALCPRRSLSQGLAVTVPISACVVALAVPPVVPNAGLLSSREKDVHVAVRWPPFELEAQARAHDVPSRTATPYRSFAAAPAKPMTARARFAVQPVPETGIVLALQRVGLSEIEVVMIDNMAPMPAAAGRTITVTDPTAFKPRFVGPRLSPARVRSQ